MPPKSKSAAAKKACPRCKGFEDKLLRNHTIEKCKATQTDISKLWEDFDAIGQPCEAPGNVESCQLILKNLLPVDSHTKHSLEAMFQKAFNAPKQPKQSNTAAKASMNGTDKLASPSAQKLPIQTKGDLTSAITKFSTETSNDVPPPKWEETYRHSSGLQHASAVVEYRNPVWQDCPVNVMTETTSKAGGALGAVTKVATNYVAVEKVPSKLYEYTIKYVSGTHCNASTGEETEREVKRRSEKQRVWEALRSDVVFTGRSDWATDYSTLWSLRPLAFNGNSGVPSPNQVFTIPNLDYQKASGAAATLSRVEFTYLRELDFSGDTGAATRTLINCPTNEKGASV